MSGSFLPSGKPTWAVVAWVDDNSVFIELPCKDGPPYIQKFAFSDAGLSKALGLMRDLHRKQRPQGGTYAFAKHPKIKAAKGDFTEAQRANARDVLKRLKII